MNRRSKKQPRTERTKAMGLRITERDIEVLCLVGLCSYLSTEQIARTLFPSPDRARRRVRQLFNANYLRITLVNSQQPNLVSLTAKGKTELAKYQPLLARELRLNRGIRLSGVEHHLAVADVRLYAAALGEVRASPMLRWSNPNGDLHRQLKLSRFSLQPDGLVEFDAEPEPVVVAVEVDCNTEPRTVLKRKLASYEAVAWEGQVDALWLVAKGQTDRLRGLERLIARQGLESWARLIAHEYVLQRPVQELPERGTGGDRAEGPNTGCSS